MEIELKTTKNVLMPGKLTTNGLQKVCDLIETTGECRGMDCDDCVFDSQESYEAFVAEVNDDKC